MREPPRAETPGSNAAKLQDNRYLDRRVRAGGAIAKVCNRALVGGKPTGAATTLLLSGLLLGGCAVGPNYNRPAIESPQSFRFAESAKPTTNSLAELPWWSVFKDPSLQALIHSALTNNYDARIAAQRVEQARAVQMQARSALLPQVGYVGEGARAENIYLNLPTPTGGQVLNEYFGAVSVLWEIDLWGRLRRQTEAARAQLLATAEARHGVTLSLVGAVARTYFELLELDERLAISKRTVNSFSRTLELFTDQHDNGLASGLQVAQARAALESVSAAIPDLERQAAIKENALNLLLGRDPGPILRKAGLLEQEVPPEVPTGLSSALLERRPDVRQAEQQLRAANALIGVAVGDFLPKIGLTAFYGSISTELSALTSGTASAWSVSAGAVGPVFQGGRLYGRYKQAMAARDEAQLHYQQTVLNALREVSDALVSRQTIERARQHVAGAVQAYQQAVEVATERYKAGKASYLEVLYAQQQLFPAERSLSEIECNRRLVIVQLYAALGGGWEVGVPR